MAYHVGFGHMFWGFHTLNPESKTPNKPCLVLLTLKCWLQWRKGQSQQLLGTSAEGRTLQEEERLRVDGTECIHRRHVDVCQAGRATCCLPPVQATQSNRIITSTQILVRLAPDTDSSA